jgi:adenine phosphoribosyltransferase
MRILVLSESAIKLAAVARVHPFDNITSMAAVDHPMRPVQPIVQCVAQGFLYTWYRFLASGGYELTQRYDVVYAIENAVREHEHTYYDDCFVGAFTKSGVTYSSSSWQMTVEIPPALYEQWVKGGQQGTVADLIVVNAKKAGTLAKAKQEYKERYNLSTDITDAQLTKDWHLLYSDYTRLDQVASTLQSAYRKIARANAVADEALFQRDFPLLGVNFIDVLPAFEDASTKVERWIEDMDPLGDLSTTDYVAGVDARGFITAMAMAHESNSYFLAIRKAGKLPPPVVQETYSCEYREASTLEMRKRDLTGKKVVVSDDVLGTGGTAIAAIKLLKQCGATVIGAVFVAAVPHLADKAIETIQTETGVPVFIGFYAPT